METPKTPTPIPQARRYSQTFRSTSTQAYREGDTVVINIPATNHTYLTKNSKLHFDLNLNYTEASSDTWFQVADSIYGATVKNTAISDIPTYTNLLDFFGKSVNPASGSAPVASPSTFGSFYEMSKPIPYLDINGGYGFINTIRVYDYLGNTLLEEVPAHDVLTAQFADVWWKNADNIELESPKVVYEYNNERILRKRPMTEIVDPLFRQYPPTVIVTQTYTVGTPSTYTITAITPVPIEIPPMHFTLDLYSFLGKLSDKFVPLHNGFRIEFLINKNNVPLQFNTPIGECRIAVATYGSGNITRVLLDPTINSLTLTNFYLKTDLLELTPEFDTQVDKVLHTIGYKYQLDNLSKATRANAYVSRILPELKSIRRVTIGQRPVYSFQGQQRLGFRITNEIQKMKLTYNKATVSEFSTYSEGYQAFQQGLDDTIDSWLLDPDFYLSYYGDYQGTTRGNQGNAYDQYGLEFASNTFKANRPTVAAGKYYWIPMTLYSSAVNPWGLDYQGRFLGVFDTRIPGAKSNTIAGIDSSRNALEYELSSSPSNTTNFQKVNVDVFVEHDALIHVVPQTSTSVSF